MTATEVTILDKTFVPYITEQEIADRVADMAAQINKDYEGRKPLLIAILNGSFIFAADLFRGLHIDAGISFVKLASYLGTSSTGKVVTAIGMDANITDRHIIIVEDIIDTGKTLHEFLPEIYGRNPASVSITTFLSKPSALQYDVKARYTAFDIENKFVVGYGLDYNGLGRNLPCLYILKDRSE
ncbi:hypoxanthine phosphoribosyltransferase [Nemorincola caseinilytica]|uniref:Hypoxanthine phosphoribosyltransferase n=2 Tax=Nemorincola caseinilytica TaxID=2054315 RepID=A0ABP8NCL3_9BACT